jgi:hypothetical protein
MVPSTSTDDASSVTAATETQPNTRATARHANRRVGRQGHYPRLAVAVITVGLAFALAFDFVSRDYTVAMGWVAVVIALVSAAWLARS